MTKTEKREKAVAVKLAMLFEGREWQQYPNHSQRLFQIKMLRIAKEVLKIADFEFADDSWEKQNAS